MRAVRIIVWVVSMLACGLASALTGSGLLAGLGIAALAAPLLGWVACVIAARGVQVELACATTAGKGAPVDLEVTFTNATPVPVAHARIIVKARNLLTAEECETPVAACLSPRSTVPMTVELDSAYCGRIECTTERVVLFEPFRMLSRTVACPSERRLTVMPALHDAQVGDMYAVSPLSDTTVFSPSIKGSDLSEVFGLREYEAGDELRRIHWKLSEKIDQMIVRDASLPLDNSLLLFWDKRIEGNVQDVPRKADTMAEVVLAIMQRLAHAGVTFEVASNDIPASRCIRSFVTDEDDIYEMIGQLLSFPVAFAGEPGLAEYRRFYGAPTCSRMLYVCCQRPDGVDMLLGGRDAVMLICDGVYDFGMNQQVAEIHFPPGGAREALEILGVM